MVRQIPACEHTKKGPRKKDGLTQPRVRLVLANQFEPLRNSVLEREKSALVSVYSQKVEIKHVTLA